MNNVGKFIIYIGLGLIVLGGLVILLERLGIHLGRLPGDIVYRRGNTTIYFPIVTMILLSILISVLLWFFRK